MDEVTVDGMGNVVGVRRGEGPAIMLAAHMDEIGLMVKYIDEKGFLRFVPLGGWFDQMVLGQRVVVHGRDGRLTGVIGRSRPTSWRTRSARSRQDKGHVHRHGRDGRRGRRLARRRDRVARDHGARPGPPGQRPGHGQELRQPGRHGHDGAALQSLKGQDVKATVYAVGTVQEEVGLKGARTSAFALDA